MSSMPIVRNRNRIWREPRPRREASARGGAGWGRARQAVLSVGRLPCLPAPRRPSQCFPEASEMIFLSSVQRKRRGAPARPRKACGGKKSWSGEAARLLAHRVCPCCPLYRGVLSPAWQESAAGCRRGSLWRPLRAGVAPSVPPHQPGVLQARDSTLTRHAVQKSKIQP